LAHVLAGGNAEWAAEDPHCSNKVRSMHYDLMRSIFDQDALPEDFPTHRHAGAFWEALGRTVATFGFLEETIAKAIFVFTGTRDVAAQEIEAEFEKWL